MYFRGEKVGQGCMHGYGKEGTDMVKETEKEIEKEEKKILGGEDGLLVYALSNHI